MSSIEGSSLSGEENYESYFVKRFTTKYTLWKPNDSEMPIFKFDGTRAYPDDPSTEKSEFEVTRVNDKIQLTCSDPLNPSYTVLAYNKKQRIEIRTAPELSAGGTTTDTIPLDWYYHFSKPKLIDLKFASGKLYRWLWGGVGSFRLVDKTKGSASKDTLVAAMKVFKEAVIIISITDAAYEKGSRLTDEIILLSAVGVVKKCEKDLIQMGPTGAGSAANVAAMTTTAIFWGQASSWQ
ncbi:hypothetical protein TWF694_011304 [Orbilia ellipsospora]|uniref:Uncharacterized protein n=1 Tax=Orbilia ellipsospora TaxID=2528407 RepID=A0AAV9X7G2_9PEZI